MRKGKSNHSSNTKGEPVYVYCLRCGRKLISKEAKIRGYGKICEQKMAKEDSLQLFK